MPVGSDFVLDYGARTIAHSSGTTVYLMYELYAWLMDQVDESGTIDDTVPMTAQTPTAYTLTNGWFIDETSIHFLKGGSLQTSGWTRIEGSVAGVVKITRTGTNIVIGDVGNTITNSTNGDDGILLFVDSDMLWIRPDTSASGDNWDSASGTITCNGHSDTQASAAVSGENIWTNIYTIGTLVANTQIYVVRDDTKLTAWWSVGQIDVLVLVQEMGTLIDEGNLTIFARQYTTLYDHYLSDFSSGARTPVPLAAFTDGNNSSGYRQMVLSTTNDVFADGDLIQDDSDATIQGVVTSYVTASNTLQYYPVGELNDFSAATGTFATVPAGGTGTAVNPTDVGPAGFTGITFDFGATSQDLNNNNGSRPYDVVIDVNSYALSDLYEYLKWVTRYGSATVLNGYDGEQYTAVGEIRIPYDAQTTAFVEGETINGQDSGATAVIVSDHDAGTDGALILKEVSGIFEDNENLRSGVTVRAVADIPSGAEDIAPVKQSPFGSFAGGSFFGARGVWLTNYQAGDANSFQLVDSEGVTQAPPQSIAVTVLNTLSGDRVAVFPTEGDNEIINKDQYSSHASNNSATDTTFEVVEDIETDTPAAGYIRVPIRNASSVIVGEDRYQYDSWAGKIFTLNAGNTLIRDYDSTDTCYVPYVDTQATSTSVSQTLTYWTDRYVLTVVRIAGMVPYKIKGQITTSGLTVPVIRTDDTVYQ